MFAAMDVTARLEQFSELQDGWLEGHGKAPSKAGLLWLTEFLHLHYPSELPLPYSFPTESGGVRFEWPYADGLEASMEVELDTHTAYWHEFDLTTFNDSEMHLALDDLQDWHKVTKRLRELAKHAA